MIKTAIGMCCLSLLAACSGGALAPDGSESLSSESLTVAPGLTLPRESSPPGAELRTVGTGFFPQQTYQVKIGGIAAGTVSSDSTGAFDIEVTVPASLPPGRTTVELRNDAAEQIAKAALAIRTDWSQAGFRQGNANYNPYENQLTLANIPTLVRKRSPNFLPLYGRVVVAAGRMYALAPDSPSTGLDGRGLVAFSTTPNKFPRLWFANLGPNSPDGDSISVAAVYDNVYAGASDGLRVFAPNCRSDGGLCEPTWIGSTAGPASTPTVYGNEVLVNSAGRLYAFPAQCVSAACSPLWSGASGAFQTDVAAVYKKQIFTTGQNAAGESTVTVFPTTCRTDGGDCAPLWSTVIPGRPLGDSIVVSNDRFFLINGEFLRAFAYDCGAAGKPCTPLWKVTRQAGAAGFSSAPSVAQGIVVAAGTSNFANGEHALRVDCRNDGGECTPLWVANTGAQRVTIANGIAFSLGVAWPLLCRTDGGVCEPTRWMPGDTGSGGVDSRATISDGVLYYAGRDEKIYTYRLP